MLTTKDFRVRVRATGEWVTGHNGEEDTTTPNKAEALIFGQRVREEWEEDSDYEIVELTETEIMEHYAQTGLNLEPPKRYNIKAGEMWVQSVVGKQIYWTARQSEAKMFTEGSLEEWRDRPGYEIVEIPNRFGIKGNVTILRLF